MHVFDVTYSVVDVLSSRSCFGLFQTVLGEVCKGILDLQLCIPLYISCTMILNEPKHVGDDKRKQ
jgi:hypothetical protein